MKIIKYRKIFYCLSTILIAISVWTLLSFGLKPGLDFTGGSLLNISFNGEVPEVGKVEEALKNLGLNDASARTAGLEGYIIRTKEIDQAKKDEIIKALTFEGLYSPIEKEFNTIGPVLGKEAIRKSYISIILVLLAIILFITFAFRKVSKPTRPDDRVGRVSSWTYGGVALIALAHDIIIPAGTFSILGRTAGFEVDTLFVTALLVILGFSVHDTIVVFDRVRENLKKENDKGSKKSFEDIVGESINETFTRSVNTSFTTLLAVIALYIWGPETTEHFALAMGIGLIAGTYSSIFIGSPLLVTINKWKDKKVK